MNAAQDRPFLLPLDSTAANLETVGGKGASLARLVQAGLPVPPGFHVTTAAYRRFVSENQLDEPIVSIAEQARADDPATLEHASAQIQRLILDGAIPQDLGAQIRQWYAELGADVPVAVRSSATAEDLPEMSFAGQQDTYLNVRGDAVLDAVRRCWASLWTARAIGYRARQDIASRDVSLAVVIQQLVPADVAGIMFTANPLTGERDQTMINAAWGLGEAIVGGHVTPDTIVVDARTGKIQSEEIADKAVMTVRTEAGTVEAPVPADRRTQPALEPAHAAELARLGARIQEQYGQPMDIEWALHDGRIFIVQARPITALPSPRPTLDWSVPRPQGQYARSSVIELLPDPLSPLFATLALPLWNDAMLAFMRSMIPGSNFQIQMLVTINDYAYYDFGMNARESARMMGSMLRHLPNLGRLLRSARSRWADEARPRYAAIVEEWEARNLSTTPAAQILDGAHAIVKAAAGHYLAIQSGILPVAYMSEAIFTGVYESLAKRPSDPPALTFMLGFDSLPIQAEKSLYDLALWSRDQPALAEYLANADSTTIADDCQSPAAPIADAELWQEFSRRFSAHLSRFGHTVYDLDFAKSLPADDPAPLIETLKYFLSGTARSPYARQLEATKERERAAGSLLLRLKGLRLALLKLLLQPAQRYAPLREDALADVGLGWTVLRRMLREVGQRLAAAGAIAQRDDVFFLEWAELQSAAQALDASQPTADYRRVVEERHAARERERMVTPPVTLGSAKFMGIDFSSLMPAHTSQESGDTIKGIGASPGSVVGAARVIHGPSEFKEMHQGDILVAKITTPAWTPLFALAGGIVTDVGGPLSHSSIVAREYHIPAVLGTGVATERIQSGQQISVDGDGGVVTITQ
ncbi:MAG TPA: PEP/pyruvate-binding domain-containing protein [Herpetosiphonaceae bacterium]